MHPLFGHRENGAVEAIVEPKNKQEAARLAALSATRLLDSPPEEAFDRLTRLVARFLEVPTALVSLVDADRQFFKSAVGLSGEPAERRETPLSHSFCKHVVVERVPLVVTDARLHPVVAGNPAIRDYGVLAYVGVPLTTSDGHTLGTLCALDTKPRHWSPAAIELLQDLAAAAVAEVELRLLARSLHEQHVALRSLELQRDEMVHMLVHDLRNPLMSVIAGLELLTPAVGTEGQWELTLAREGALNLKRMVSDILDVSKADAERLTLARQRSTPADVVAAATRQVRQFAAANDVELRTELPDNLPAVEWDVDKIVRVFVNLLSNAVQHTRAGGYVMVTAKFLPGDERILWMVNDTGEGIPSHILPILFQKFGHSSVKRAGYASSGLGLAFSERVVEAHGGSIWVESELGRGTSFGISLPLR